MKRVLIIEDEPGTLLDLRDNLAGAGYDVLLARDGEEGVRRGLQDDADIILLDGMLPRMSGLDICRRLRSSGIETPIIMLTVGGQEPDGVDGLEAGADDCVTKPFSTRELLARVRAQLRRAAREVAGIVTYRFGSVELDFRKYRVTKAGQPIGLSRREFETLRYLVLHRDEIVTRDQMLDEIWGYDNTPITRTVDNHIAKLRHKIEDLPSDPQHIVTVHRLGYRFVG